MNPLIKQIHRRAFLMNPLHSFGAMALGTLLAKTGFAADRAFGTATDERSTPQLQPRFGGLAELPHFSPRAKRVVCLFQSGGLSHVDLFDDKPSLHQRAGENLPDSVRGGQRLTGMTAGQAEFPVVPALWPGKQCGQQGIWISNLLPHLQSVADELCMIKSVHSEAINHDPAITLFNTGNQQPGYASMGAWLSYGLGSENEDLPAFIAMVSQGRGKNPGQPIFSRLWGSGFLPSSHQGVGLRPGVNAVPFLQDPQGTSREQRRQLLDDLNKLNSDFAERNGDPETLARIDAYEMAYRMQVSVPELTDLRDEPPEALAAYGPDVHRPGSYAANCFLARRLLERGVRFVQLFHRGWDQHIAIQRQLPMQCQDIDQPSAALIRDLKTRGLLDDTLVLFFTEFGRTVYGQGRLNDPGLGRDHHGRCFTVWMAGGGVKPGFEFGATDEFGYNIVENPIHLRDLHATVLHCLGIDHARFSYPFRGLNVRLTGVEEAHVIQDVLS
ncbi:MAG TPA: DUF1501 domain-containing protein [Pirellulaceae bacterium]|nr:DUF1501 domain-containing protein [Pirellulaceae bacterium]HMO91344.1 DUF1501 domain-containing protein [Pirellulaceae bacterium]HMP70264.1 DUF1501 domain-containing protein [Pirellulaceae bacterium]